MRPDSKILLFGAMLFTSACGQSSNADASQTTDRRASAPTPVAPASSATKATALPIELGVYAEVSQGCARATRIFFYDISHYGDIYQAIPEIRGYQSAMPAYSEIHRILRVGPSAKNSYEYEDFRGFTRIWADDDQVEMQGIQSTGQGRFIRRRGEIPTAGPNGGQFMGADDTYQLCAFSQLSPQMQATIRAERPQMAGAATPSLPLAAAPIKFPPIPKGYYAVGTTCARAANAQAASDGPSSLARFDESALTWFDGGPEIRGFESLGNNRFRVRARSYGNGDDTKGASADFVIRITGASSFVTEPGSLLVEKQETYTHCPTNIVPKAVRDWFEG